MSKIKIVIGAGWGDEGKGLMTDALASFFNGDCTVVRFNGGAQAGHTVVTPQGQRHVFGHVGAGTFMGAKTFLSKFFIINPLLAMKEINQLNTVLKHPIQVHPEAIVTTPYDMILNHLVTQKRGWKGSCGVGINETVTRSKERFKIKASNLSDMVYVKEQMQLIRLLWLPERLNNLGITLTLKQKLIFENKELINNWYRDVKLFSKAIVLSKHIKGNLIFEGAQGLMLDQTYGEFPYVTRSNTGLCNVVQILEEMKQDKFEVIYMTRAYATRHGAGPFPNETLEKPYPGIVDLTNVPNEYQGDMRFGYLDLDLLNNAIRTDLNYAYAKGMQPEIRLGVTCLDQIGNKITFVNNGELQKTTVSTFLNIIENKIGASLILGHGPTRESLSISELTAR
jgi:adenylosuccinate synthase